MKLIQSPSNYLNEELEIVFKLNGKNPKDIDGFKKVAIIGSWIDMGYKSLVNSYLDQTDSKLSPVNLSNYTKKFTYGNVLFHFIDNTNYKELKNLKIPVINWGAKNWIEKITKEGYGPNPKYLYNRPEEKEKAFVKSDFYKLFEGEDFITKTVYSYEDAKKLTFPIVAKPDRGHTGVGITKFDTCKELEKYKYKDSMDLYQEAIEIKKEIRVGILNDKAIFYFVRKPMDNKSKYLAGKEKSEESDAKSMADKELDFKYIIYSIDEFYANEIAEEVMKIARKVRKKIDLEFIVFDIAIDNNNKQYVIEINVHPGVPGSTLADIYLAVYEDFYKKEFPKSSLKHIQTINRLLISATINLGKYVYSNAYLKKNII